MNFLGSLVVATIATLVYGSSTHGQTTPSGETGCLAFDVPEGHWSLDAARRLEGLGQVQVQSSRRPIELCRIHALFQGAVRAGGAEAGGLTAEWLARLEKEYPWLDSLSGRPLSATGSMEIGAWGQTGRAAPGTGEFPPSRTGALPLPDQRFGRGEASFAALLFPNLSAAGVFRLDGEGHGWQRLELVTGVSPLAIRIGRGDIGFGYAQSGGVVTGRGSSLNRLELATSRPVRLPGAGSRVGSFTFDTFLGRVDEERHPGRPYLWGASGSVRPHPRVTLSINRAALFGREGTSITGQKVLEMLIGGLEGGGFENQVVSVESVLRLPTERILPATVYLEWGAEDAAGALRDVPGRILGLYLPALPGAAAVSLGVEYSNFAESCCGNPEWYRHWSYPGAWTLDDRTLGHPLGGHGQEWMVYSSIFAADSRMNATLSMFRRNRGIENLFVPGRQRSAGGDAAVTWRLGDERELFGAVAAESGDGWRESSFSFGGRLFFN